MTCPRPDKQRHASRRAAQRVVYRMRRKDPTIYAYRCVCGWWHVGRPQLTEFRLPAELRGVPR